MSNFSRKRVAPIESASDIIEIRPSRYLRIQHHNSRPRDEQFDREMGIFMQYKKSGIPSSGPLTMSKRMTSHISSQSSKSNQDNVDAFRVNKGNEKPEEKVVFNNELVKEDLASSSIPEDDIPTSYVNPSVSSSVLSSPSHTKVSDKVQSASSVLVSLHMSQQENHKCVTTVPELNSGSPLFQKSSHKDCFAHSAGDKINLPDSQKTCKGNPLDYMSPGELNQGKANNGLSRNQGNASVDLDTVLFFIHGVGGSSDIWCAQIRHFAQKGYEIIAPDLIGHGFSCCPKNAKAYHFKEIAADMEELFDKYCKRKNVVVGHSYGGSFATLLARTRSRRIQKLILISSGPPTPLAPQPGVFTLPTCLLACIKPCLLCCFNKGAFHQKRKPVISKKNAFSIPTIVLQHMMNGQIWPDGDELYHNWLTCECLLIYGAEDQLVSLQDELDTQRAIFNSYLEVVKEASHMVMMEAPDEVNDLIANFIDQTSNAQNQDSQRNTLTESSMLTSSFKRQKSAISLKSHVPKRSESHT